MVTPGNVHFAFLVLTCYWLCAAILSTLHRIKSALYTWHIIIIIIIWQTWRTDKTRYGVLLEWVSFEAGALEAAHWVRADLLTARRVFLALVNVCNNQRKSQWLSSLIDLSIGCPVASQKQPQVARKMDAEHMLCLDIPTYIWRHSCHSKLAQLRGLSKWGCFRDSWTVQCK